MTQDERYYVNMLLNALKSILSDSEHLGYQLPNDSLKMANRAILAYETYDQIKLYKKQESELWGSGRYDLKQEIHKQRLELENQLKDILQ